MKITNVAIDNRTSIFVLIVIIAILGLTAYVTLPREASPDVNIPLVIVSTPYFGVAPEDIESLVTTPIEKEIKSINEVKKITSSSFEGYSLIQVEFQSGYSIDEALQKIRDKVDKAKPELPVDAEEPEVVEINISEIPIITLNLSGNTGLAKLKDLATDLKDEIEKIKGVLEVKVSGGLEREVKVDIDFAKLQYYNVRFDDVIDAIRNENKTIPGGTIDVNSNSLLVRVPGEFKDPLLIDNLVVKTKEGKPVYVKDIASLSYSFKERTTFSRNNGIETVSLNISKSVGENIIRIAEDVQKVVKKKQLELPATIQIKTITDQSTDIAKQVRELENNIYTGLFLVVGILFFALGLRNAFFVSISVPLSMLITFFILQMVGITLNFVVLFGLVLALGMLVDNAIVVIENIQNYLESGYSRFEAAKLATAEVAWPITSSTLTTVAAFLPLLFWPGVVGDFMKYIPITVIASLSASLFVALLINPVIAATFMKLDNHDPASKPKTIGQYIKYPFSMATYYFVEVLLPKTLRVYENFLRWALGPIRKKGSPIAKRNWLGILAFFGMFFLEGLLVQFVPIWAEILITIGLGTIVVLIFSNIRMRFVFGAFISLYFLTQLYGALGHGVEFFPDVQPQRIYITIETPTGTGIETTNQRILEIEKRILDAKIPDIREMLAIAGASNNPFDAGSSTPNKGTITIEFIDYEIRKQDSKLTTDQIRDLIDDIPGTKVIINKEGAGPPVGKPVNIEISGENLKELGNLAALVKEEIKDVPGLVDLDDDYDDGKPEVRVVVDRERASLYGLNTSLIAGTIRTAVNGTEASKYRVNEEEYDITVRLGKDQRGSIEKLRNLKIIFNNKNGKTLSVPLGSVADIKVDKGPSAVRRINLDRVITVSGEAEEGVNPNEVLNRVKTKLAGFELPGGYNINFTGQSEEQDEASAFLGKAFLVALLLIFLILVIQFNSVSQPFIIMSAVVISLVGVFIGLIAYAMPFGIIMTGIGVISLAGVVVNNNIVLIDYTNVLIRTEGMTRREAIVAAGIRRFRPVTLTAITTVLGIIPLAFGFGFDFYSFSIATGGESQEFWRSMGIAVIFGLIFATFLTLVIVPILYSVVEDIPDAFRQLGRMIKGIFTIKKKSKEVTEGAE